MTVCEAGGACRSYCDTRQDALFFNAIPGNAWWWVVRCCRNPLLEKVEKIEAWMDHFEEACAMRLFSSAPGRALDNPNSITFDD